MPTLNPFDDYPKANEMRLPWMALFIIAMMTILVGWMVFTSTPSVADTSTETQDITVSTVDSQT